MAILLIPIFIVAVYIGCALLLQFSARLAGVHDATLKDAIKILIFTGIIDLIVSGILSAFGLGLLGGLAGLVIAIAFIARYFGVTYSKALVVWAVNAAVWIGIILLLVFFIGRSANPACS